MSVALNFERITRKWASLRRFAGLAVDSALNAIEEGHIDVAPYFAKLIYFLPFASRSLEKVLTYSLVKAIHGYVRKDSRYFEITVDEVPGFEPDEADKVKEAFESMRDLGLADIVSPTKIRLKVDPTGLIKVIRPISSYIIGNISPQNIDLEALSYPYRVVSGVSSLYVMQKGGRLPSSLTIMLGLISPTAYVKRGGAVERKNTIEVDEWNTARSNMAKIRNLKDKFDVEYFKAIGVLHENRIITKSYPIEVSGDMIDFVIAPAYHRYYTLLRQRRISRARPWRRQRP